MGRGRVRSALDLAPTMRRGPRTAFLASGVLVAWLTVSQAVASWPTMRWTALAWIVSGSVFVALVMGIGGGVPLVGRRIARHSSADLSRNAHAWALLLLIVGVFVTVVFGSLVGGVAAFESEILRGGAAPDLWEADIVANVALSALLFVVPVWVYVRVVHAASAPGAWRLLGLAPSRPARDLLVGVAVGGAFLLALSLVGAGLAAIGFAAAENELALEIAGSVSIAGALVLALGAAVGEEIFFRGFLQPRIGIVGQALVFMSGHLAYLNLLELVVTFTLAVAFGLVYRRSRSLVAPMVAHFVFNAVMLVGARFAGAV